MDAYARGLRLSAEGQHARAIDAFQEALAQSPNDTRTLFALGNTAKALNMPEAAEDFFTRVLALEPERLEASVNLANLFCARGAFATAEALLRPALVRHPHEVALITALALVKREDGSRDEAMDLFRQALAEDGGHVPALVNLADLLADDGKDDEALAFYDRALKAAPGHAQAKLNRAVLHLLRGRLKEGWQDYAARLKVPGKVPLPDHGLKRWSGDSLKRTRLLVTAEQGVGDQMMFASLIPELAARAASEGGSVVLEAEPRLVPLFARSFDGVTVKPWLVESRDGKVLSHYGWLKQSGGAKAAIELGSLAKIFRKSLEAFPKPHAYLKPDGEELARWKAVLRDLPRPLIGICWRSGGAGGSRHLQHAPLKAWADFLRGCPGTPVCVQYDAKPDEIQTLNALSGRDVVVPQGIDQKQELDRAAALFAALDVIASAPTAVSWLAAGLGVATYKLLYDTSWTAFGRDVEPFAPSCRLVMPRTRGDWGDVFVRLRQAISQRPV